MKRHLFWLLPLLFLLAVLIFFPQIASTPLGKPFFTSLLQKRFSAKISIERLRLSWFGPQRFEEVTFSNPQVEGKVEELQSNVPFWSLSEIGSSFELKNGTFSFPAYGGEKLENVALTFKNHNLSATGSTPQGGSLFVKGTVFSKQDFDLALDLKEVPTGALDQLLKAKGLLYQLLGSTFNLSGTVAQKKIDLALSSPNSQAKIQATLTKNAIALTEPFLANFRLTSNVSPSIFSRSPITLRLSPKNFRLPYRPFSLKELQIGDGLLDPGQMILRNQKALESLVSFLKNSRLRNARQMNAWFTPVNFQIQNGLLKTGRMDILLADSVHICTWGNFDLLHNQLDMVLGIPAETLSKAFGLKNIPPNYVLPIPIRGSLEDPDLVTGPAVAKIAAMVAAQQLQRQNNLLGHFLQFFAQAPDEDDTPPPNRPFPWER